MYKGDQKLHLTVLANRSIGPSEGSFNTTFRAGRYESSERSSFQRTVCEDLAAIPGFTFTQMLPELLSEPLRVKQSRPRRRG